MNTSYIPTSWSDPEVKKQSIAVKYRREQEQTCMAAISACNFEHRNCAVELYAGNGGLTQWYKKNFIKVITNDLNKQSFATFHYKALDFIDLLLPAIEKIDLIDFDCYGCPMLEIQKYFEVRKNKDVPFVIRFSDGLGLFLKRNKNQEVIRKRYLIEDYIDMNKIWLRLPELIDFFFHKIANQYGMKAKKIVSVVTKHKNYCLGAYEFTNIN